MTKEELVALGLSAELADKVVDKFGTMIPKSRFDEVNTRMKKAEDDVSERDKQIDGLKKSVGDSETLKKQIEDLQKSNKAASEKYAADLRQQTRDNAIALAFTSKKARNIAASRALVKFEDSDFDENNGLNKTGIAKIEADIKANGWAYDVEVEPSKKASEPAPKLAGITPINVTPQPAAGDGNIGSSAAAAFLSSFNNK